MFPRAGAALSSGAEVGPALRVIVGPWQRASARTPAAALIEDAAPTATGFTRAFDGDARAGPP